MAFLPLHSPATTPEGDQVQQTAVAKPEDAYRDHRIPIVLRVGERRFETFHTTLTGESTYFAARLSDRWGFDDNYFIDADPDVFQDVLAYLRSGIPPLFYNAAANAFDYERYMALLGQARYFGIAKLEDWIENERYLAAINTKYTSTLISGDDVLKAFSGLFGVVEGNVTLELHPTWSMKKIYLCPRAIPVHRGKPEACGMQCRKAGAGEYEEEKVLQVLATQCKVLFNPQVCLDGAAEE